MIFIRAVRHANRRSFVSDEGQRIWSELLELGEKDAAMDFLLRLNRNMPESHVPEIAEMITETAEFQARGEGGPATAKGARTSVVVLLRARPALGPRSLATHSPWAPSPRAVR